MTLSTFTFLWMLVPGGLSPDANHLDVVSGEWTFRGTSILWFLWQPPNIGVASCRKDLHHPLTCSPFPGDFLTVECAVWIMCDSREHLSMVVSVYGATWALLTGVLHGLTDYTRHLYPFSSEGTWGLKGVREACGWWTVRGWILKMDQVSPGGVWENQPNLNIVTDFSASFKFPAG